MPAVVRPLAVCLLLCLVSPARAGEYTDPSGFSFTYPDDWIVVTSAQLNDPQLQAELPPKTRAFLTQSKVDLRTIVVAVIHIGPDGFSPSLNVIVTDPQVPATDQAAGTVGDMFVKEYSKLGVTVHELRSRVERVGDRNAVVLEATTTMPDTPERLHHRQVFFPGGGRTFSVTASATADTFQKYRPAFEGMLSSFRAPEPQGRGLNLNTLAMRAAIGGIVGGVIAGLAGLFRKLFGGRTPSMDGGRA